MAHRNATANDAPMQHSHAWPGEEGTRDDKGQVGGDITPQLEQTKPSSAHPVGLLSLGLTLIMLGFINTGWAETGYMRNMMTYALIYGGFALTLAGVFELVKGNPFAGTAFVSYGSFWGGYFLTQYFNNTRVLTGPIGAGSYQVGATLALCLWGVLSLGLFVPTLHRNKALMTMYGSLAITFFLLAGGQWDERANKAAGYVSVFCGCSAMYTAFAELYEATFHVHMPGLATVRYL